MLARAFHQIPRSRLEALLASFPRAAESGTQHTTVEDENVRFVYQPLDELYMVLITNKQSNILQDIDSLHLFAQVVTSTCKSLEEREILKNAYELMSAFDELVTLGYRENLTISQIKTFLEMESHEERIQEIIARVRRTWRFLEVFCRLGTDAGAEQRTGGDRRAQEESETARTAEKRGSTKRSARHASASAVSHIYTDETCCHGILRFVRGGEEQVEVCALHSCYTCRET